MRLVRVLSVSCFALLTVARATHAQQTELPEGVTSAMIAQGEPLYRGQGLCAVCHGPDGTGVSNLGANLTDDEWLHSDGSFAGILQTITQGVSPDKSSSGTVMPPKGGSTLSDEQLRAVAAYVWSLGTTKQ